MRRHSGHGSLPAFHSVKKEFGDWRLWWTRAVVLAAAGLAGLTVVALTWLSDLALGFFFQLRAAWAWIPMIMAPACAAAIVWATRRWAPGAAGSGIPQVMAALNPEVRPAEYGLFVSLRLSIAKILLTAWGLLAGLSLGREGPSVQIAAGVMLAARRLLPRRSAVSAHGLLVAGGAAGIAAAFNTPLGGVMFAIEELSRTPEQRSSGLLIAGIVLAGLIAESIFGNGTYFGVIHVAHIDFTLLLPGLLTAVFGGIAGGVFAKLLVASFGSHSMDIFNRFRRRHPVWFAAGCGLTVALIGAATGGAAFGSGYSHTRHMLEGVESAPMVYVVLKFAATWITAWSGVPAGIFSPSLAIGAALGNDVALLTHYANPPTLIALGMAGFLAAATQAPLTSFIIVMEMVDGHEMVLSLMACSLVASAISRLMGPPLYASLSAMQLQRLERPAQTAA